MGFVRCRVGILPIGVNLTPRESSLFFRLICRIFLRLFSVFSPVDQGTVCFAIINRGGAIESLRSQQDQLIQELARHWQLNPTATLPKNTNNGFNNTLGKL